MRAGEEHEVSWRTMGLSSASSLCICRHALLVRYGDQALGLLHHARDAEQDPTRYLSGGVGMLGGVQAEEHPANGLAGHSHAWGEPLPEPTAFMLLDTL